MKKSPIKAQEELNINTCWTKYVSYDTLAALKIDIYLLSIQYWFEESSSQATPSENYKGQLKVLNIINDYFFFLEQLNIR